MFTLTTTRLWALAIAISATASAVSAQAATEEAVFAGGCFWCMEPPYDKQDGVISTTSGYIGGSLDNPSYEQVVQGDTGHAEAVKVVYDSDKIGYEQLLDIFWRNIDPFAQDRQFCDVGSQYRAALFPLTAEQTEKAQASLNEIAARFDDDIATAIETDAGTFWEAEEYHQNYYQKNPLRYNFYRFNCGRDNRLEAIWGDEAGGVVE